MDKTVVTGQCFFSISAAGGFELHNPFFCFEPAADYVMLLWLYVVLVTCFSVTGFPLAFSVTVPE
jgi:hypothetical protein